jgi:hypothetical protein
MRSGSQIARDHPELLHETTACERLSHRASLEAQGAVASVVAMKFAVLTSLSSISLTLLLSACAVHQSTAKPQELLQRAAFDLDCPEASLSQAALGQDTFGVSGCGKRATYVSQCNGQPGHFGTTCRWVMNSAEKNEITQAAPASSGS